MCARADHGYLAGDLPMTEDLSGRLLRLPMFAGMRDDECEYVMSTVADYLELCS